MTWALRNIPYQFNCVSKEEGLDESKMANPMLITKVIIHKSGGEVFLVEQDTIECVSSAYLKYIFKFSSTLWFSHLFVVCNFLVRTLQYFLKQRIFLAHENIQKLPSKGAYFTARIFSTSNQAKTSPNLIFCPIKWVTTVLTYT